MRTQPTSEKAILEFFAHQASIGTPAGREELAVRFCSTRDSGHSSHREWAKGVIQRLVRDGLIYPIYDEADKRKRRYLPTKPGKEVPELEKKRKWKTIFRCFEKHQAWKLHVRTDGKDFRFAIYDGKKEVIAEESMEIDRAKMLQLFIALNEEVHGHG